ncbi:MAG: GDP-mannose 4,6-dehydratase [Candidatus Andersenbacteria bacterium]
MGKRYLVTGGAGFIGSHLVDLLLADPEVEHVTVFDKFTYAGDRRNLLPHWNNNYAFDSQTARFRSCFGDVADATQLLEAIEHCKPDGIFHLAAESHVDRSILNPASFILPNILGAVNLLEAARFFKIRTVYVSTDEVMGDSVEQGIFTEESEYHTSSPYSWSKAAADQYATQVLPRTYADEHVPVMVTRGCNHFGPRQQWEKFLPRVIMSVLEDESIKLYGNGLQERTWLHVLDGARALQHVMRHGSIGEVYLVGPSMIPQTHTNEWLAETVCNVLGKSVPIEHIRDRPGHDRRYAMSAEKLMQLGPGWKPRVSLVEGLRETVRWYQQSENLEWVRACRRRDKEFAQKNYAERDAVPR